MTEPIEPAGSRSHRGSKGDLRADEAFDKPLVPLYVDLDGTLIRSDSLQESLCSLARREPTSLLRAVAWLIRDGKAGLKARVAQRADPDPTHWPYNQPVLDFLREQRASGREIFLATAADQTVARRVAAHCGVFSGVIASDGWRNLAGRAKLEAIYTHAGGHPFAYAGNEARDLEVWPAAASAVVVGEPDLAERAKRVTAVEREFRLQRPRLSTYVKALRIHHWTKNLLVLLPLLPAARHLDLHALFAALLMILAFSFTGSATYLLNDLLDLEADRLHPRKRHRPLARGDLSIARGVLLGLLLVVAGFLAAGAVGSAPLSIVAAYLVSTTAYSLWLKRVVLVDVLLLAALYAVRVIGGAVACDLPVSFWLLAFSGFLFFSLALVKRVAELIMIQRQGGHAAAGRGYRSDDREILQALGVSSGLLSVLVLGAYVTAPSSQLAFASPHVIALLCPLLLYWICRVWLKVHRGEMNDDPVVFAFRDNVSRFVAAVGAVVVALAVWL